MKRVCVIGVIDGQGGGIGATSFKIELMRFISGILTGFDNSFKVGYQLP